MYGKDKGCMWHTNFIGVRQQHNYWLYKVLDEVMQANSQIRSIVEIGTGNGALTMVLGLWGVKLSVPVLSVDINQGLSAKIHAVLDRIGVARLEADERGDTCRDAITACIAGKPCLLICDGGNKPEELRTWAPRLPAGSVIAGHDWSVEIHDEDVANITNIEPLFPEKWMEENVQMAWWTIK